MASYELSPAYGRDYKSAKEVKQAWAEGQDFQGDYQLGFGYVNIESLPKPASVMLRYKHNMSVVCVNVAANALPVAPAPKTPKKAKAPSIATMERWMADGVAKATDGCRVEPDGRCGHGKPSWLLYLGYI